MTGTVDGGVGHVLGRVTDDTAGVGDAPLERSIASGIVDLGPSTPPRPTADESERVRTIDGVFSSTHRLGGELSLRYAGYDVTVKSNGVVHIEGPAGRT